MNAAKSYLDEARAIVPSLPAAEVIARHGSGAVFVDVRDSAAIAKTGTIAGARRVPRGMLEFMADPSTQYHDAALAPDAEILLVCGAGGQAALAGRTLLDMGYRNVTNIGGIGDWQAAGGPMEEA